MHEAAPAVGEYEPPVHGVHVASLDAPVTEEEVPGGQGVQVFSELAPVSAEYVPRTWNGMTGWDVFSFILLNL